MSCSGHLPRYAYFFLCLSLLMLILAYAHARFSGWQLGPPSSWRPQLFFAQNCAVAGAIARLSAPTSLCEKIVRSATHTLQVGMSNINLHISNASWIPPHLRKPGSSKTITTQEFAHHTSRYGEFICVRMGAMLPSDLISVSSILVIAFSSILFLFLPTVGRHCSFLHL
jgi:hypothetical protein